MERDVDAAELAVVGPPLVVIRGAVIRFNPAVEPEAATVYHDDGDVTLNGMLTLSGFDKHSAGIMGCHFIHDQSLPPGSMILEPKA